MGLKRCFFIVVLLLLLGGCQDHGGGYSYLRDPSVRAERVHVLFETKGSEVGFTPLLQARELFVEWGDGSGSSEFVFGGSDRDKDSIGTLRHVYEAMGVYEFVSRAYQLSTLRLPEQDSCVVSELGLSDCRWLSLLDTQGHPIERLDVSPCPELTELVCGAVDVRQVVSGLDSVRRFKRLIVHGLVSDNLFDLSSIATLEGVSFVDADLRLLSLERLSSLERLEVVSCDSLSGVGLANNMALKEVVLRGNIGFSAVALDTLFRSLPQTRGADDVRTILLDGNRGDESCDRSIARAKGWVFR